MPEQTEHTNLEFRNASAWFWKPGDFIMSFYSKHREGKDQVQGLNPGNPPA